MGDSVTGVSSFVAVHYLLATDADWIVDEVTAALGGDGVTFAVCREGRVVADEVQRQMPDLAICDLQIGSMGAMAVTMALRLDESAGRLGHVKVMMLLDRAADLHLARRSGAEGWLVKPLDALRLRLASEAILGGGSYTEGVDDDAPDVEPMVPLPEGDDAAPASSEAVSEPAP